jgi:N-sulfoglucosamine sulfohydrolase
MSRPHILYIHSHDTGRYIQPYGYGVPAPHLQELAEQGMLFRQAFCANPTCSASRAALLTGQCAHSSGMLGLTHRGFDLYDYGEHLVHTLHTAGYHTVLGGLQHEACNPEQIGYDELLRPPSNNVANVVPGVVEFLGREHARPFFLSVGFSETHRDFRVPGAQQDDRYCRPPAPIPDTPQTRRDMAGFSASVQEYDHGVGQVLQALDANGLAADTLVICTTDHGIAFPGMKCNLTDHGLGVMLIMRGPGGFSQGRVSDAMVSQIDLFPTICDLLGVDAPDWLQGRSLMALARGETDQVNEAIFAEVNYHAAYQPQRAVRTPRWKYIRHFGDRHLPALSNCDDGPSKDLWVEHGWAQRPVAPQQLYDLVFDPNEVNNLAADPAHAGVLAEMRQRLRDWMERTRDPLLGGGPVPAPAGARINHPDDASPRDKPQLPS